MNLSAETGGIDSTSLVGCSEELRSMQLYSLANRRRFSIDELTIILFLFEEENNNFLLSFDIMNCDWTLKKYNKKIKLRYKNFRILVNYLN